MLIAEFTKNKIMLLEKIISISGKPGLYKLVSQLRNGFIIEDVTNKKKRKHWKLKPGKLIG